MISTETRVCGVGCPGAGVLPGRHLDPCHQPVTKKEPTCIRKLMQIKGWETIEY